MILNPYIFTVLSRKMYIGGESTGRSLLRTSPFGISRATWPANATTTSTAIATTITLLHSSTTFHNRFSCISLTITFNIRLSFYLRSCSVSFVVGNTTTKIRWSTPPIRKIIVIFFSNRRASWWKQWPWSISTWAPT